MDSPPRRSANLCLHFICKKIFVVASFMLKNTHLMAAFLEKTISLERRGVEETGLITWRKEMVLSEIGQLCGPFIKPI